MREEGELQPPGTATGYGLGWRVGGLGAPLDEAIWHTGAAPGYSAMLFLLPERNIALVLEQNLYGLLHDDAVMQVGFGAARVLADGRTPPADTASASSYYMIVWGVTAVAAALILAAGRSALLLRRPATPATALRRTTLTALWCLVGALPWIALAQLAGRMSLGQLMTWVPDAFIAVSVAAAAGAATIGLRLVLAIRSARVGRSQPQSGAPADVRPSLLRPHA
ncbi:hypothetical protein GCM10023080_039980 [Streptomyces pseudoechinosporeus]